MNTKIDTPLKTLKEATALRIVYILTGTILTLVLILHYMPRASAMPKIATYLPALNAILNGTTFLLLIASRYFIWKKKIIIHRTINITAFGLSTVFLLSYVAYHAYGNETVFPADNPLKPVYLFILITHILCAAIVLPLVLISMYRGLSGQFAKHRKIVKWSYPIWLYVTATGVIVYLMISPYYKF